MGMSVTVYASFCDCNIKTPAYVFVCKIINEEALNVAKIIVYFFNKCIQIICKNI